MSGAPSTNKAVISQLREEHPHWVLDMVLKHRSWRRGSTMLGSYLDFAGEEDIIHPNIKTCGAATSRESCSNPNLQNVEKTGVLLNPFPVPSRTVFRPRPGFVNFHIDYAGIELRLLVHYSDDKRMIEAILKGEDVHALAAEVFYGDRFRRAKGSERTTLRGAAKNANFAIPYGASGKKVGATLGIGEREGMQRYAEYRRVFPGLCGLTKKIIEEVLETGHVLTAFGRKLYIPKDKPYIGTNYKVQGTAAGVIKRAQVRVNEYIQKNVGSGMQLLLPIHDEIILECERSLLPYTNEIFRDIREMMIDFPQFKVPMEIEISVATVDWEHKKEVKII